MSHVDDGTLHAYLDGELTPVERSRMEAHVAECAPCRARLAEERDLIERADRLLALATPPAGAGTGRGVPRGAGRPWRYLVPGVWAASVAAAFLTGWLLRPSAVAPAGPAAQATQIADAAVPPAQPAPPAAQNVPVPASGAVATTRPAPTAERQRRVESRGDSAATAAGVPAVAAQAPAPGVVGAVAEPRLRGGTATPIPPTAVTVGPPPRAAALARATDYATLGTTWTVIAPDPARRMLGTDPVRIPGLPVRDILQNPGQPGTVLVEQELAAGTVIQLLQSRSDQDAQNATDVLRRTVGHIQVRISGPLSTDSLLKLLQLAR